jgi:hypothetical protein
MAAARAAFSTGPPGYGSMSLAASMVGPLLKQPGRLGLYAL